MKQKINAEKPSMINNQLLDYLKFFASILILLSHSLPIFPNVVLNHLYGQWFFRFCVPMFLVSAGYYFCSMSCSRRKQMIKRVLILYLLATILYYPLYSGNNLKSIVMNILFGYHHLWYLSSLLFSLIISYFTLKYLHNKKLLIVSIILFPFGVFFDEYYRILNNPLTNLIARKLNIIGGGRCALLFALPLILLGCYLYQNNERIFSVRKQRYITLVFISSLLALVECLLLTCLVSSPTIDVSFFSSGTGILVFILSFYFNNMIKENKLSRQFRKAADILYIIHIWVITITGWSLELGLGVSTLFNVFISIIVSFLILVFIQHIRPRKRELHS